MFYIERSVNGPCLCSDLHDCLGMDSRGLGWFRNGSKAMAFPTKKEAEEFCKSHKLNLDCDKNEFGPRYVIVEELRLPEIQDIAERHGAKFCYNGDVIVWGDFNHMIQIVKNTDVAKNPRPQRYEYVVGAKLVYSTHGYHAAQTVIEEIHNPSYKQLEEFVAKCVTEHGV